MSIVTQIPVEMYKSRSTGSAILISLSFLLQAQSSATLPINHIVATPDPDGQGASSSGHTTTFAPVSLRTRKQFTYEKVQMRLRNIALLLRVYDDLGQIETNLEMNDREEYKYKMVGSNLDLRNSPALCCWEPTTNQRNLDGATLAKRQVLKPNNIFNVEENNENEIYDKQHDQGRLHLNEQQHPELRDLFDKKLLPKRVDDMPVLPNLHNRLPLVGLDASVDREDENDIIFANNMQADSNVVSHPLRSWLGGSAAEVALNLYRDVKVTEQLRPGSRVNFIGK